MSLKEQISAKLKESMKAGDAAKVSVFRMLIAAINNKEIAKQQQGKEAALTDEEFTQLLMGEAKKRKEAAEAFQKGNRAELAEKERLELVIIQEFLPKQMSPEETEKAVEEVLKRSGVKEIGPAMKEVMKELRGKADSGLVSEIVKKKLSA